jgi:2-keto-4-pentenoate hydratase/2-oxohepta-3-ene-1,7-dioic acid hydratase in catechol pathway
MAALRGGTPMKVAAFWWSGRRQVGMLSADGTEITPLALGDAAAEGGVLALIEYLEIERRLPKPAGPRLLVAAVRLDAPLPRPRRNLFCVGRNYRSHAQELASSGLAIEERRADDWPMIFTKPPETVIGPGAAIRFPRGLSEQIDYEAEMAVVIGRGGTNIRASRALEHVWGYTIVNDVTARDIQQRHQQWFLGKSLDTFCPMGPCIVSPDECDGMHTRLCCWVNGELRQEARTEEMIFDVPTLIETCSRGITLYPGDVIATGTPAGVGIGMTPPRFLRPGDVVRIEIDGIGRLENPVD